jgi:diaminohydroxyphosphoribosylaminopyrimidine deaminase / 5-amino-6-(5-phosphoribosylamino)uracil reductase
MSRAGAPPPPASPAAPRRVVDPPYDVAHMRSALALARRGLGQTWPNPSVGCVIVNDGRVLGRATTAPGGRPHAETQALAMAGASARGATAYVTLEPCAHHGKTPPCAEALIEAGIARVVIASHDPDPRVAGRGVAMLRQAGIEVIEGVLQAEGDEIVEGFVRRVTQGRPMVTLKLASTLDGRIATVSGESKWITGPHARRRVQMLRATHDAVMVGIGTALADDPDLNCRLEGARARPLVRVVADSDLRLPLGSRLATTAQTAPVWLVAPPDADAQRRAALTAQGVEIVEAARHDPTSLLTTLGARGLTRVLVEGGGALAASLLAADLVDRIVWFHAPAVLGADALPAVAPMTVAQLADMQRFERVALDAIGPDIASQLRRLDLTRI